MRSKQTTQCLFKSISPFHWPMTSNQEHNICFHQAQDGGYVTGGSCRMPALDQISDGELIAGHSRPYPYRKSHHRRALLGCWLGR